MNSQQPLGDYIASNLGDLTRTLIEKTVFNSEAAPESLVSGWLNNHILIFRDKPCRTGEWAAQFVEISRSANIPAGEAFSVLKSLHKTLMEACLGKISGIADIDIVSGLCESSMRFEQAVVEYFAQRVYEDSVAGHRRQKAILESVSQPMAIINAEGVIDAVNRSLSHLFKSNPDAFAGQNIYALCDDAAGARLRAILKQKRVEQSKSTFRGTIKFGAKTVDAQFNCQPFFDVDGLRTGAAVFIDNDGEDKAVLDAGIHYLEEHLLPLAPFALQVSDREGNVSYNSDQVGSLALPGYDGTGPVCCYLHRSRYGEQRECSCLQMLETGHFHMEEIGFDTPAGMKWFMLFALPLPDDLGHITRVATCIYDMTQRKQIQKQLESHILKQQRSSLVAQLSITVAHQLRNPLSVVLGFAEMLAKGLAPDQYAEAVSRILRNSIRCKDIVENLLDFGKGMPLERRPLDLEVLIRESVRTLLTPAQNRLIEWRFSGKPAPMECVPEQMVQVVLSLLDNAIRMAQSQVVFTVENKSDAVRLRVADDGPGIPLELRERIFEPFFTTRREEGATGLGLSLARAVAADYSGSLTVAAPTANEPRGACLVLHLPLMKKGVEEAEEKETIKSETKGRRVLIVDDETDLQDLLKTTLSMRGFKADTASTGMEALEQLKVNEYDAVVLDYLLKGSLSGRQLYQEIVDQYPALVPRILFITANMLNYQTRLFVESTGRPVLEKPFLIADFITELARVME